MKINLSKKDVIWSYLGTILSMSANFLMLPVIVHYLDKDTLGLWYVFVSLGAVTALFDFGFAVTFARNITYCWSGARKLKKEDVSFTDSNEPDYYLMKKVLHTCKIIYLLLASGALLLLLGPGTLYINHIADSIAGYRHMVAWVIYCIAVFLNLYYGYYASFLRGVGAIDAANKNTILARLGQIITTVVLLGLGYGIIGASIAYLVYGTTFRLLSKRKFYTYKGIGAGLNNVKDKFSDDEIKELFFTVWHNAWRDGLISLSNFLCDQASILLCALYLDLATTGSYSIGVQIATALAVIAGTMYNAYQPVLQNAYINRDIIVQRKTMGIIIVAFVTIFVSGVIGFIAIGRPILEYIKPDITVSMPIFIGLCVYQFILKFRNCYTSYFSCTNRIIYLNGFIVSSVLCVVLSYVFLGLLNLGVYGIVLSQILSQALYNMWYWPMLAHQELGTNLVGLLNIGFTEVKNKIRKQICALR